MSEHPPLCPKTIDAFQDTPIGLLGSWPVAWGHLHEANPVQRRYLARYQACAWHDRHLRWSTIYNRIIWGHIYGRTGSDTRKQLSGAMARACLKVSRAWREWEKLP